MENPDVHSDAVAPRRESLEKGSPDLEQLLQTAGNLADFACCTCIIIIITA